MIMPLRAGGDQGFPSVAVARSIVFAADHGAAVINTSLGFDVEVGVITRAIEYAVDAGVVIVAASGSDGFDDHIGFPASARGVISVGATTIDDGIAVYSNGGRGLDLVAPGGHCWEDRDGDASPDCVIQETRVEGDMGVGQDVFLHKGMNGTSLASPHVAGAAALLVGVGVPADRVEGILEEAAVDLGREGYDRLSGAGRLDAAAAVAQAKVELGL
jgi:serine protease